MAGFRLKETLLFAGVASAIPWSQGNTQSPLGQGSLQQNGPTRSAGAKRPNIIFILTDDQDIEMGSLDHMPFVQKHLIDKGTLFRNHFVTTAICCPSRVSLWTGLHAHNTNVTDINPPYGTYYRQLYIQLTVALMARGALLISKSRWLSEICFPGFQ